jgi:hypothetical protein
MKTRFPFVNEYPGGREKFIQDLRNSLTLHYCPETCGCPTFYGYTESSRRKVLRILVAESEETSG